jgi:quinol monooxygenase YgiN
MFGFILKVFALPGERENLLSLMASKRPVQEGQRSFAIAADLDDDDGIWITGVWDSQESHKAGLSSPEVREIIERGKPLIGSLGLLVRTRPVIWS